jgi:hypothetical protein
MLILSAVVTMLVQFVATTLLNLKGRALKAGIAQLLALLDKHGLTAAQATGIADHILRNSLLSKKLPFVEKWRLANVIHREELTTLILDFAGRADLENADQLIKGDKAANDLNQLRIRLLESLKKNGIADPPREILTAVRRTMLALEENQPELANDVRQTVALLTHASSEFLAKVNAWFDQTIDRTVDAFTTSARVWTVVFAAAVAIFFEVNTFELIKRLSVDDETRQMLVSAAIANPDRFRPAPAPETPASPQGGVPEKTASAQDRPGASTPPAANPNSPKEPAVSGPPSPITPAQALNKIRDDEDLKWLMEADLISWPKDFDVWLKYWMSAGEDWYAISMRLLGVLLTISLLSLGAPVWYEVLKNLINLRSVVARKDDAQRLERQTSQEPLRVASSVGPARSLTPAGERGDLEAVG